MIVHAATLVAFFSASNAPTPLYPIYQAMWQLPTSTLTIVFGVYPLALLCTLLIAGKLSDFLGRKPVILASISVMMASLIIMGLARDVHWLIVARIVQGAATGLGAVALNAVLIDIDPHHGTVFAPIAPSLGGAFGAFGTACLVQYAPAPTQLAFALLFVVSAVIAALSSRTVETVSRSPGALRSLRPSIAIPTSAKSQFLAISPFNIGLWGVNAFFMSLLPSLMTQVVGPQSVWLSGVAIATTTLSGVVGTLVTRGMRPVPGLLVGGSVMVLGVLAIIFGASLGVAALFFAGCAAAGAGGSCGYLGALRCVLPSVTASERGGLMAAILVQGYLANSLPPMIAGYFARHYDLMVVSQIYGVVIILLVCATLAMQIYRGRIAPISRTRLEAEMGPGPVV